ncbi:iron-binding protein [Balamuthia mandrillaris]
MLKSAVTNGLRHSSRLPRAHPTPAVRHTATSFLSSSSSLLRNRHYHERVIDHYENPRNVGSLPKEDPNVGTGIVGAPACGDVENGRIVDARFKTFGCGSAIASSSLVTEWIKGKTLEEAQGIRNTEIAKHLSLPPVKLHCSMLAEDAIKASLKDYEAKRLKMQSAGQKA